jgi:phage shock protein PspC (stress-responsive transcriptional regulator)
MKWVRANDGAVFGVCKGIARTLDIPVGLLRLIWIISVLFFGAGILLYLMLAITLPRQDKAAEALQPWILGVCSKIALRTDLEVGIVRFLAVSLSLISLGATVIGYVILYFVLDNKPNYSSDNKPNTPSATV